MEQDTPAKGTLVPVERAEHTNGTQRPERPGTRARARVLQAQVEMVVGLVDEDGMPAATVPVQKQTVGWRDPSGHGRSIGAQVDDLIALAEKQAVEAWETQNAG